MLINAGGGPPPSGGSYTSLAIYNDKPVPAKSAGRATGVDSTGAYWVGGDFDGGELKFVNVILASNQDLFVAKISAVHVPVFDLKLTLVGMSDNAQITDMEVDASDNVWIYGYLWGTMTFAGHTLATPTYRNVFTIILSPNGTVLLATISSSNNHVIPGKLCIIGTSAVVTGSYVGTMTLAGISLSSTSYSDGFVIKLTNAGVGTNSVVTSGTGSRQTMIFDIDIDSSTGDLYAVGRFTNSSKFGTTTLTATGANFFVAKLSSSLAWQSAVTVPFTSGTSTYSELAAVKVSGGIIYAIGTFKRGALNIGSSTIITGGGDVFVVTLTNALVFLSANQGFTSDGKGVDLAANSAGDVWATGILIGTNCNFSGTVVSSANYNLFLAKVSSATVFSSFTSSAASSGSLTPSGLAIGANNAVVLTGIMIGGVNLGGLTETGTNCVFTAVYVP